MTRHKGDLYLAVEIGGSKLQAALGDGAGAVFQLERVKARPAEGREGICRQIAELVGVLLEKAGRKSAAVAGAAIGFGGPVDARQGLVLTSHQVGGWSGFPLVDWFRETIGLPVVLGNDSDLAGLGEAHFGAGKGFSPIVYMNIGSGIGGALVVDGRLYTGQGLGAAEIGHLRIRPDEAGKPWRTLESLASGWGMANAARNAATPGSTMLSLAGGSSEAITTEILIAAARQGDEAALEVWQSAIEVLGVAIANVTTLLHPARFILGGGVSLVGEFLLEPLRKQFQRQAFAPFVGTTEIVLAGLGEEVVLHGALKLAREAASESLL
jgi:glucokinase